MDARDASRLIAPAVEKGQRWADLGAGTGTFTAALARLVGPSGTVYAVERDHTATDSLDALAREHDSERAPIVVARGDFTQPLQLPSLDGVLLANALHFVDTDEQAAILQRIAEGLVTGGAMLVIEYDNRSPSQWVPFPVSLKRLRALADAARLAIPQLIGRRRSEFGGTMYAARMTRR